MSRKSPRVISRDIAVEYRRVGGWHVFTSEEVPGLYVAHEDCKTAYEAVAGSIEVLLQENQNIKARVQPTMAFERFIDFLRVTFARWIHGVAHLSKRVETAQP